MGLNVLITGGARGLGRAMADEFATHGDRVIVLARRAPPAMHNSIKYVPCDVRSPHRQVLERVNRAAKGHFNRGEEIDVWVNNAAVSGGYVTFENASTEELASIIATNFVATAMLTKLAIDRMGGQERGGHVFNVSGAGADHGVTPFFAAYGASKSGVSQMTRTVRRELLSSGSKVKVHLLSPGMMKTPLLFRGVPEALRPVLEHVAEDPSRVARNLVTRMRNVVYDDADIEMLRYFDALRIFGRFVS